MSIMRIAHCIVSSAEELPTIAKLSRSESDQLNTLAGWGRILPSVYGVVITIPGKRMRFLTKPIGSIHFVVCAGRSFIKKIHSLGMDAAISIIHPGAVHLARHMKRNIETLHFLYRNSKRRLETMSKKASPELAPVKINNLSNLTDVFIDEINLLRAGSVTPSRVNAIANIGGKIMQTVKLAIEANKYIQKMDNQGAKIPLIQFAQKEARALQEVTDNI